MRPPARRSLLPPRRKRVLSLPCSQIPTKQYATLFLFLRPLLFSVRSQCPGVQAQAHAPPDGVSFLPPGRPGVCSLGGARRPLLWGQALDRDVRPLRVRLLVPGVAAAPSRLRARSSVLSSRRTDDPRHAWHPKHDSCPSDKKVRGGSESFTPDGCRCVWWDCLRGRGPCPDSVVGVARCKHDVATG